MVSDSTFYTDIHSHFIFDVDDGAKSIDHTLLMLKDAADKNFWRLIATPHITDLMNEEFSRKICDHFSAIQKLILEHQIPIQVSLASELYFSPAIYNWLDFEWATFNNQRKYLLFELPFYEEPPDVGDFIFKCRLDGITPILAHPERYQYLSDQPQKLAAWHEQGCLMQADAGSIIGQFGQKTAEFSKKLLKANLIQAAASDAHDHEFRSYGVVRQAENAVKEYLEEDYIKEIFQENPRRIYDNEDAVSREIDIRHLETVTSKILSFLKVPISSWFKQR